MADDRYDAILREVMDAAARDQRISKAELLARHRGDEATVRRVLDGFELYERLRARATDPRPVIPDALVAGDRLGDFEIEAALARGGMGVVYRARQLSLGSRAVALKVLDAVSASDHAAERFEREALALASLHHPHLAEVYGFGMERGVRFLAMRLVAGPTLRDALEIRAVARPTRTFDDARERRAIVERIAEVADALALVHSRELVHRDVKPSNIVLEGAADASNLDRGAVLVDFGLVRRVDARTLTQTGASPATPSYASPEQLLGHEIDARSDVFSLGVTMHDLLSARRPTDRLQASTGLEPIASLVPAIDADLAAVVGRAVDPEARWRYANASEFRDDLRAWLAGDPVSARRRPWREHARRWVSRHPWRLARAASLGVGALLAVVAIARSIDDVRSAESAFERGDVRELGRLAGGMLRPTLIALFSEREVSETLQALRAPGDRDPLHELRDRVERNDFEGALFIAAEEIGRSDAQSARIIETFFLSAPEVGSKTTDRAGRPIDVWSTLIARVFYESPVESPARARWAEPYRSAILRVWDRTDVSSEAKRYLVTALGNCGTPEDAVQPLLAWALDADRTLDDLRFGLRVVERLIVRSHSCATVERIPFDQLWTELRARAPEWNQWRGPEGQLSVEQSIADLVKALLIAERAVGREVAEFRELMPAGTYERACTVDANGDWLECLALAGDVRVDRVFESAQVPASGAWRDPRRLGRICAFLPDGNRAANAVAVLDDVLTAEQRVEFHAAAQAGRGELRGTIEEEALDPDTLLGAWRGELKLEPLPRAVRGWRWPLISEIAFRLDLRNLPAKPSERIRIERADAWWLFDSSGAVWGAAAFGPVGAACVPKEEGPYVRLPAFGRSQLVLPFDVAREDVDRDRVLVCRLQTNARNYYPSMGRAEVAVDVNDARVETFEISSIDTLERTVAISWRHIASGRNTIAIRLLEASTTPLRVYSTEVRSRPVRR